MYAVIQDSGRQFKVSRGDQIEVDIRDLAAGVTTLEFPQVLLVGQGSTVKIGQPYVAGAKVVGKLLTAKDEAGAATLIHKGPKLITVKYKKRKGYHRKVGHRSKLLKVQIEQIVA